MKIHELKSWIESFADIATGSKTFDWRQEDGDRIFHTGDLLVLYEFDPEEDMHTGHIAVATIDYILRGDETPEIWHMPNGFCILGINIVHLVDNPEIIDVYTNHTGKTPTWPHLCNEC